VNLGTCQYPGNPSHVLHQKKKYTRLLAATWNASTTESDATPFMLEYPLL
jgi:hypothetical protein